MATRPPGVGVALSGYDTETNSPPQKNFKQLARHWALGPPSVRSRLRRMNYVKIFEFFEKKKINFRIKWKWMHPSTYLYIRNATSRSMVC